MALADKLVASATSMTQAERACLKILLASAAAGLMPSGRLPVVQQEISSLSQLISAVTRLQPHRARVPSKGFLYRGRPDWLSDDVLRTLQEESRKFRPDAVRFNDHLVASGAPRARAVAFSRPLLELLDQISGPILPTGKANYLYYDEPGMGIEPHLDTEEFALNVILMLEHIKVDYPSALILFPPNAMPERIYLHPGEIIVIFADSTVHAREPMKPGERVGIAAFGFTAIREADGLESGS